MCVSTNQIIEQVNCVDLIEFFNIFIHSIETNLESRGTLNKTKMFYFQ